MRGDMWDVPTGAAQLGTETLNGVARPSAANRAPPAATPNPPAHQYQAGQGDANSGFPQVVASSPGLAGDSGGQFAPNDSVHPQSPGWQRNVPEPPPFTNNQGYAASPGVAGDAPGMSWNYQQPLQNQGDGRFAPGMAGNGAQSGDGSIPGEGHESAVWFDQLFATSFSAIDNPFLAAAHLDPSIDPTWSYLR